MSSSPSEAMREAFRNAPSCVACGAEEVRFESAQENIPRCNDCLDLALSAALSVTAPKCSACNGTGFVMGDGGTESNCGKCTAPAVDLMQHGEVDAALFRFAATWRDDTVATRVVNARKLMQAILAALSVVPVEPPVGWAIFDKHGRTGQDRMSNAKGSGGNDVWIQEKWDRMDARAKDGPYTVRPLYLHPPASPQSVVPSPHEAALIGATEALVKVLGWTCRKTEKGWSSVPLDELPEGIMLSVQACVLVAAYQAAKALDITLDVVAASPRAAEPTITDAMAERAMRECAAQKGESHEAMWSNCDEPLRRILLDEWKAILAEGLGTTPAPSVSREQIEAVIYQHLYDDPISYDGRVRRIADAVLALYPAPEQTPQ